MTDAPDAPLELYYHPLSRAANVVWMLEEVGVPYTLRFVDIHVRGEEVEALRTTNAMGKLPTLVDGDAVITESAAIGVYLADRYAQGRLSPTVDSKERGTFLRWSFFAPSVIEPGCYAQVAGWEFRASSAGWGAYDDMLNTIESAIGDGPWLLGDTFSMADVIFGGTVRYMLQFEMLEPRDRFTAYRDRLNARPASKKAQAINAEQMTKHGIKV
ncbi:MAG: glutathione S-transferase family protein [Myxococcota bacterium]